ncbi:hypothetical protein HPB51_001397 [Rhipicephalus microplus]|uniref:DDE Tnp4 domain-containing protein n=1 Tax=Rhipicephalus microplus TaxID=6941 RepID=A0A9J6EEB8_RHIMP|nr:hypothetical protein HPB51_001397 [Rhipicephalus microplus]
MDGSATSAKRTGMLLLLDSDSSESESSSTDTSDSSDSDSDAKACAYEREFNKLFRIPAKRPKVVGFIEDVVRQYSDHEVSGMPAVIGCIDGSYVQIQCPANKVASTYCNRHHYLSLTLQAVCDHKRHFLDAFTGTSSKMHDSRVFSLSPLSKNIASVCQGRYHILGDAAYPLREYLLTPYRDYGAMNKQQKGLNFKFSGTRVLTENAFSTLKKRFRHLMYLELLTIHWLNQFIISCCILHNLCIDYGDEEPDDDNDDDGAPNAIQWENCTDNHSDKTDEERALHKLGEIKREKENRAVPGITSLPPPNHLAVPGCIDSASHSRPGPCRADTKNTVLAVRRHLLSRRRPKMKRGCCGPLQDQWPRSSGSRKQPEAERDAYGKPEELASPDQTRLPNERGEGEGGHELIAFQRESNGTSERHDAGDMTANWSDQMLKVKGLTLGEGIVQALTRSKPRALAARATFTEANKPQIDNGPGCELDTTMAPHGVPRDAHPPVLVSGHMCERTFIPHHKIAECPGVLTSASATLNDPLPPNQQRHSDRDGAHARVLFLAPPFAHRVRPRACLSSAEGNTHEQQVHSDASVAGTFRLRPLHVLHTSWSSFTRDSKR